MAVEKAKNARKLAPLIREFFLATAFGARILILTLIFLAAAGFFTYKAFSEQYTQIEAIFQVVDPEMQHQLVMNDIVQKSLIGLAVSIVAYIIIMIVLTVRAHHKYTGPLVSIQRFIDAITAGNYDAKVVLRKGDLMTELQDQLNEMGDTLKRRHGKG